MPFIQYATWQFLLKKIYNQPSPLNSTENSRHSQTTCSTKFHDNNFGSSELIICDRQTDIELTLVRFCFTRNLKIYCLLGDVLRLIFNSDVAFRFFQIFGLNGRRVPLFGPHILSPKSAKWALSCDTVHYHIPTTKCYTPFAYIDLILTGFVWHKDPKGQIA